MSIQNRAMLVSLSIGMFSPRKTDKKVTREVLDSKSAKQDAGKFVKVILPEEALKPIKKVESEARDYYYKVTCPWTDEGARILPSQTLMEFTEQTRRFRHKFEAAVDAFMPRYSEYQEQGRVMQGDMYNADDYPGEDRVRSRFYFKTAFLPFPDGGDFRTEVVDEEQRAALEIARNSLAERVKEASDGVRRDLWSRLETPLRAMAERLGDPEGVFRDTLITNLQEIVSAIPALNITNDPKLNQIRDDIQTRLTCYRPESLRRSPSRRREAAAKANDILKSMSGYFQSSTDAPSAQPMELPPLPPEPVLVDADEQQRLEQEITDDDVPRQDVELVPLAVAFEPKLVEEPTPIIVPVPAMPVFPARPAMPAWRQRMQHR